MASAGGLLSLSVFRLPAYYWVWVKKRGKIPPPPPESPPVSSLVTPGYVRESPTHAKKSSDDLVALLLRHPPYFFHSFFLPTNDELRGSGRYFYINIRLTECQ